MRITFELCCRESRADRLINVQQICVPVPRICTSENVNHNTRTTRRGVETVMTHTLAELQLRCHRDSLGHFKGTVLKEQRKLRGTSYGSACVSTNFRLYTAEEDGVVKSYPDHRSATTKEDQCSGRSDSQSTRRRYSRRRTR